jgi:hypothetical protein
MMSESGGDSDFFLSIDMGESTAVAFGVQPPNGLARINSSHAAVP